MEIAYISDGNVKLKGKQVTLITALPGTKNKTTSDAVLLLGTQHSTNFFAGENGIIFQGPGEYEVKGTKITGFASEGEAMYTVSLDGLSIFVGNVSSSLKMKDRLHEHDIAVLFSDETLSQAVMSVLDASVFIFSGTKNEENAKAFGKELITSGKYVVTKDKLPAEKEFVFLG